MYNEQQKFAIATYSAVSERAAFFANMEIAVSLLALFFQAVVVTWLTRRGSVAWSLSAMPAVVGLSFIALALFPVAAVFLATQVLRRAADYGLGKPPREMLFTVLNPESKFKSKSLIDTAFTRAADALGQWLYLFVGSLGLVGLAWLGATLCVVLLWATRTLGRAFETRRRDDTPARAA
jgi:AAA family ATP:ADP antiporter